MADILALVAASWGVLMAVSPALQIRRMLQRHSSADVSLGYLLVLLPGFCLWMAYGVAIGNAAIIIPNAVALTVGALTTVVAWRLRHGDVDTRP